MFIKNLKIGSRKRKSNKGFALLELIITLGIIGVIASISIPNYLLIQQKTAEKSDKASSQFIGKVLRQYIATSEEVTEDLKLREDIYIKLDSFDITNKYNLTVNNKTINPGTELYNLFIGVNNPAVKGKDGYLIKIPLNNPYELEIKYSDNTLIQNVK